MASPLSVEPIRRLIRACILAGSTLALLSGFSISHRELTEREAFYAAKREVRVIPPDTKPELSQESIDFALEMFGIVIPAGAAHPTFDASLADRGVTIRGAMFDEARVAVGPSAFESWSLLGSTLAHELEVHCQQSFFVIYMMDLLGLEGTVEAERQAYLHELANAERFGLDRGSRDLIADTMDYFYPTPSQRSVRSFIQSDVRRWMALNLLGTSPNF